MPVWTSGFPPTKTNAARNRFLWRGRHDDGKSKMIRDVDDTRRSVVRRKTVLFSAFRPEKTIRGERSFRARTAHEIRTRVPVCVCVLRRIRYAVGRSPRPVVRRRCNRAVSRGGIWDCRRNGRKKKQAEHVRPLNFDGRFGRSVVRRMCIFETCGACVCVCVWNCFLTNHQEKRGRQVKRGRRDTAGRLAAGECDTPLPARYR